MIAYMGEHSDNFDELLLLSLSDKQPYSWKAAQLLLNCMIDNDPFLRPYTGKIVDLLLVVCESQQRIFLMILQRMEINSEYEGRLFDICVSIWKDLKVHPSLRGNALWVIFKISKKYPELLNEIRYLIDPQYTNSLPVGIKHSLGIKFNLLLKI